MIDILFCGNSKIFDGILTCMLSILKRTETKEPFNFYIFTMDLSRVKPEYTCISDAMVQFLERTAKTYNKQNRVTKIDVTQIYEKEFGGCPNEQCYCSPYTLIRLLADLVPDMPKKLLYLDIDLLFNRDIRLLWDTDVTGYEYAAARDHYGKIILFFRRKFINAGVILFNLEECKKTGLLQKARGFIKTKKLLFADESAIILSTTKQKVLSQRFNDQKFLYKDTVIRHFSKRLFWLPYPHVDNIKQWRITKVHKIFGYENFDEILYEYVYLKRKFEEENPNA